VVRSVFHNVYSLMRDVTMIGISKKITQLQWLKIRYDKKSINTELYIFKIRCVSCIKEGGVGQMVGKTTK